MPGCNTDIVRINNNSWTITVHLGPEIIPPRVGVNNANPKATLDVAGELVLGSDGNPPVAGMIKWDAQSQDFMGYDGAEWKSLTLSNAPFDPFPNSLLLNDPQKVLLNSWVGSVDQKWQLCYRRSVHGAESNIFHANCDYKGPTVVIIKLDNQRVFGGYTTANWISATAGYSYSDLAFLFSIDNEIKYPINRPGNVQYNKDDYGPTFGGGHDIYVNESMNIGYLNFPHSYTAIGFSVPSSAASQELCGIDRSTPGIVLELEVWYLDL